jgi:phage repressor protein C with HTH and peptisase S24 domain
MRYADIIHELDLGREVTLKPHGNSMTPIIQSGQEIVLSPIKRAVKKGDIVLAKVKGRYFIHKVTAVGDDGAYQISNNHGHVNGWSRQLYGIVTSIG